MNTIINDPIIIIGCPRSGTSMVTGIIDKCGAWGGVLFGPNDFNKKGMFENIFIRNEIIKPYLSANNWDRLGQNPLPDISIVRRHSTDDDFIGKMRNAIVSTMKKEGYNGGIWYIKEPKITLIWPIFNALFPSAKWVIIRRDVEDIVRSCLRTRFMRAYNNRSGWIKYVSIHERRFEEIYASKLNVQEIWPQRIINGDLTQVQMVVNNLGLNWDNKEIKSFVEPMLWNKGVGRQGKTGE